MAEKNETWREEIVEKLLEVFADNKENFIRVILFLDNEDKAYKDNKERPYAPHWKSLKATLKSDEEAFHLLAKRLSDETKNAENNPKYRELLNIYYETSLTYNDSSVPIHDFQRLDRNQLVNHDSTVSAFPALNKAWQLISAEGNRSLMNSMRELMATKTVMTGADDVVGQISDYGGSVVMVTLAITHLSLTAITNIKRWWSGEISGKRCIKNLVDSTIATGASILGGAYFGSNVGFVGAVLGGVGGGLMFAGLAKYLTDWMTQKMFGLPKDEALENAYRYLDVEMTASNAKINTAFRKLCLKHHPDKGGKKEDFLLLQFNTEIIREARGEY